MLIFNAIFFLNHKSTFMFFYTHIINNALTIFLFCLNLHVKNFIRI